MRPFEEPHTFAWNNYASEADFRARAYGLAVSRACYFVDFMGKNDLHK
jgi:hypothetical protein